MLERHRLNHLLCLIAARYGLGHLELNENGVCGLLHHGRTVLMHLTPDGNWFCQSSSLGPLPTETAARLAFCETLLAWNHPGGETQGLILSVDSEGDTAVAHHSYPFAAVADDIALANLINAFLAALDRLEARMWGDDPEADGAPNEGVAPVTAPALMLRV